MEDPLDVVTDNIDSEATWSDIEEVRVTGQTSSNALTSATESATRFDSDLLEAVGANDLSDLAKFTPNLEIRTAGATSPTFFIRGVGLSDFNANAGGAIAIYQDGVAMNTPALQLGQLFDIGGVEVLRGPQGTGAGRNASGGAIKVNSVKPAGDGQSRAFLLASYGNYNSINVEGALETPILGDTLSTRVSFRVNKRDGWGTNGCGGAPPLAYRVENAPEFAMETPNVQPGFPPFCSEQMNLAVPNPDYIPANPGPPRVPPQNLPRNWQLSRVPGGLPTVVNDVGDWAARSIFRLLPESNESEWLLIARGSQIDQQSTLGQAIGTNAFFGTGVTALGYKDPDITALQNQLIDECSRTQPPGTPCPELTLPILQNDLARHLDPQPYRGDYNRVGQTRLNTWGGSLEGMIPIEGMTLNSITAYDAYNRFRDQDDDFTSEQIFESVSNDKAWQFSQEVSLEGEWDEYLLSWEIGGYTLIEELESSSTFFQNTVESNQAYQQQLYSFAFYAGFSWQFSEALTLEAGARYNWEEKAFEFTFIGQVAANNQSFNQTQVWQAPTGSVRLLYEPLENLSFYWKYSRGWKGGQFNASSTSLNTRPAEPESIDALELGWSGYFWADRVGVTGSLFYYMYNDYQVFVVEDSPGSFPQEIIINANAAQNYGAEVEARISPLLYLVPEEMENLLVTVRFGWLNTEFLDFTQDIIRTRRDPGRPAKAFPVTADYSGNPLINAPEYKVSLGVEWEFSLGDLGYITPRYDGSWSDDVVFGPNGGRGSIDATGEPRLPELAIGQEAFWLHNVSFVYQPPMPNVEIMGWVRNVSDVTYKTFAFDGSFFASLTVNWVGEPRTFGGSVRLTF
ncbi:MAG: TonB-dependent receptor [Myxococcota bacterium]|nr:TonB-dependent receptor [Myxococcota bacterium]MDG2333916.1 TonB-dependent receptor [Myxococcota bacterium]